MDEAAQPDIEREFDRWIQRIIRESRAIGYNASWFTQMVGKHGSIGASRRLLSAPPEETFDGFTTLYEKGTLDLTVEYAAACEDRFATLFTSDERRTARERPTAHRYECP